MSKLEIKVGCTRSLSLSDMLPKKIEDIKYPRKKHPITHYTHNFMPFKCQQAAYIGLWNPLTQASESKTYKARPPSWRV